MSGDLKDDTKPLWQIDSSDDDGDAWNTGTRLTQGQVHELAASFAEATDPRPVEGQQRRIPAADENCRYFALNQSINSADHCVGEVATFGITLEVHHEGLWYAVPSDQENGATWFFFCEGHVEKFHNEFHENGRNQNRRIGRVINQWGHQILAHLNGDISVASVDTAELVATGGEIYAQAQLRAGFHGYEGDAVFFNGAADFAGKAARKLQDWARRNNARV
jgi:hypothetical protein